MGKNNLMLIRGSYAVLSFLTIFLIVSATFQERLRAADVKVKDLASIKGVRDNALIGYGLVVGLQGTGDSAAILNANKSLSNLIQRLGMEVGDISSAGSVAGVIVTSSLKPFSRIGDKIGLRVSTIGDATSLQGGTLLLTPLRSGDGQVYAMGQGPIATGQANGSGNSVLTVARVPGGGVVEKEFLPTFSKNGEMLLSLHSPDFTTASRLVEVININFKGYYAETNNPGSVTVKIPPLHVNRPVDFVAALESLKISVDRKAVVVINERTGTVVMGDGVVVHPVAISHGDLSIKVEDKAPKNGKIGQIDGTTVGELVESLNQMGAGPKDLVGILKALHSSGALQAELKFL